MIARTKKVQINGICDHGWAAAKLWFDYDNRQVEVKSTSDCYWAVTARARQTSVVLPLGDYRMLLKGEPPEL